MKGGGDVFERARRALSVPDALRAAGCRVRGGGFARHWAAGGRKGRLRPCPICGAKSEGFSFCESGWRCWHGGGASGSVVDLVARLEGCAPLEAARRILGEDEAGGRRPGARAAGRVKAEKAAPPRHSVQEVAFDAAGFILRNGATPDRGPVEVYLTARGVAAGVAREAARALLFRPCAAYRFDGANEVRAAYPAMVAIVAVWDGAGRRRETGGVHCTYLAQDYRAKAALDAAKKMWGPQGIADDGAARPGGVLLIPPKSGGWLCVAEGIETTLCLCSAVRAATGAHAGAFAALSLGRLQGGMASNRWGRPDYFRPAIDPARPPALFPHPGGRVVIGVDHDMKTLRAPGKVNQGTGEITPGAIIATGARRAQVCGLLAAQWWARPIAQGGGGAAVVRVAIAPKGKDWADAARALGAAGRGDGGMAA